MMMYRLMQVNQRFQGLFGLFLTLSIALIPLAGNASTRQSAATNRDFLPPVANINPRIDSHQTAQNASDKEVEEVAFPAINTPASIRLKPKIERLADELQGQAKTEQLQTLLDIQKKVDTADLEYLWQATVEKNPVIRFSLEKLATPADLQTKQSSRFLSKTVSTLISGASMATSFLPFPGGGNSMYPGMGAMAVGNAIQNMITGRTHPTPNSLSPTEQIQLASLIDELKGKLIRSYQDYKSTLENLAQCHEVTLKNNALYSKALVSKNDLAVMATGSAYYQTLMHETALRQQAKLHRMELERLAGPDAVSRLELAVHVNEDLRTAVNTPTSTSKLAKPVDPDEDLPYAIPEPMIGPQPLIGPELQPSAKTKASNRSTSASQSSGSILQSTHSAHIKTSLPENRLKLPDELEPIEVLSP